MAVLQFSLIQGYEVMKIQCFIRLSTNVSCHRRIDHSIKTLRLPTLDAFRGHLTDKIKEELNNIYSVGSYIPGGEHMEALFTFLPAPPLFEQILDAQRKFLKRANYPWWLKFSVDGRLWDHGKFANMLAQLRELSLTSTRKEEGHIVAVIEEHQVIRDC